MPSARVSKLLVLFLGVLAAASVSTGTVWAAAGVCEALPGGVIELESTGGAVGPTGYATLGAALADVNNGAYTGVITIDACGDTTEGASAVLNASGTGGSSYTGVTIVPAGGAPRTISGSIAGALLDLNGAGGVVIDGLNSGGNALTFDNPNTGASAAAIRFIADASGNTVQNCTISGATTGTASGTIVFAAGTSTGNVNNTITANTITSSAGNLPVNAIYSAGASTSVANTGIAITNNSIQDYFSATLASNGILVASNSAAWTITGNRLFQTANRTATTANTHRAINIVTASGGGYTVSNNTVGYASAAEEGTTTYDGAVASLFRAIEMTVAVSPVSNIQGNTVTAISFSTTSAQAVAPGVFAGISVLGGSVNVGTTTGNTIGSATTTGAISVTSTVTGSLTDGIYVAAPAATVSIQNNSVGGITASSANATIGFVVRGIETAGAGASMTLSGNTVGSTTVADSIRVGINGTTTAVTTFAGILNGASGTITATSNTIQNDSVFGTGNSIFQGISNSGTGTININGNSVIAGTSRGAQAGISQGIVSSAPATTVNVNSNIVRGMILNPLTTSAFRAIEVSGAVTSAININDNAIGDATAGLVTYGTTATGGTLYGINLNGGTAASVLSIQRNDFRGVTHTGTVGAIEVDCFFANSATAGSMTIVDNTITNLNVNTSGSVFLVRHSGNPPPNPGFQTITNNRIVGTFNKAQQGGQVVGLNLTAAGDATTTMTQSSNNFSNVTVTGTTTGLCITTQAAGVRTVQGNVCNNWVGGSGGALTGIRVQGFNPGAAATVTSNTITNFSSAGTLTGIQSEGSVSTSIVTSNTINTFSTTNGNATGIVVTNPSLPPIQGGNISTPTVTSNTISGLSATGSAIGIDLGVANSAGVVDASASLNVVSGLSSSAAGAASIGIRVNTATRTAKVFRNKVYDIQVTGATGTVTGLSGGGGANDFYNNLVGDLRAPAASTTGNPNVIGLAAAAQLQGTNAVNFYDNTVYIAGTSSGAPFATAGVFAPSGPVLKLRNNIVANASVPTGSGRAVAVWRNYQPLWSYDTSSNNNDLYASTAYYDGVTAYTTLSDMWAVVSPRESASFSENPPFLSTVGSSANFLHIVPASTTLLESHAVNISIPPALTDDYDADIRQGNPGYTGTGTAPDVGADEFEGVAQGDVQPPAIVYALLGAGAPVTSRSLTATITDATGVATTAGVRPRVYFKKSTDANDETGWKYVEATGSGDSPFDFTIDYTLLNGGSVSVGDTIQYFVVAQDTRPTPNVGIFQGAFAAGPTSVALTPAAFPIGGTVNSYTILTSISGDLTVCPSGCDYTSLTNGGGLFETLNGRVFTGNITVYLDGDSTAETGLNALNQWPEDPAGNYTLTIQPRGGATRTVSGNLAGGLIRLNGADRVTIDGLNTDGNSLTMSNASTVNPSATIYLLPTGVLNAGASNNTIQNLTIVGGANTIGVVGIAISGSTIATAGADNDGNTMSGNTITKVYQAIYVRGSFVPPAAGMDNLVISNNTLGPASPGADNLGLAGIYMYGANNPAVSGNTIRNLTAGATAAGGIYVVQDVAGGSIANNTITNLSSALATGATNQITGIYFGTNVTNLTVSGNKIQSVSNTLATGAGARGIIANSEGAGNVIANNMVSDIVTSPGTSANSWPVGIHVEIATTVVKVYNNSVNLYGPHTGNNVISGSAAMYFGSSISANGLDLRDNVFANSYDNSTSATERTFAVHAQNVLNTGFADINFNDYYVNGPVPANSFIGNLAGTNHATLAAWKAATTKDASSIAANPQFVSNTDLHINTSGGATPIENVGTPLLAVTNDVEGDFRHAFTPDMGADEVRCHAVIVSESCDDSNACTVDSCNTATGACGIAVADAGTLCRAAAGSCDLPETCDGIELLCPDDTLVPALVECRSAAGDCDTAEVCTGVTPACPADAFEPSTVECRASTGVCDVAESCTGSNATCPADAFEPSTVECRASAGACDPAESCTGSGGACPADALEPATTACRPSAGDCDVVESCSGSSATCPADAFEPSTVECRGSAGTCDVSESCSGSSAGCPDDVVVAAGTECRASSGAECDPAELCDGETPECPKDAVDQSAALGATVALSKVGGTTITWTEVEPGPFNVYRGADGPGISWSYNQGCMAQGVVGSSTTDSAVPASGQFFYYLISRTTDPCDESTLGQDSTGSDRPNLYPCPDPGPDTDSDTVLDVFDNCKTVSNVAQADADGDGHGDDCDNCPAVHNPSQEDGDADEVGDACDPDLDNDGVPNGSDNCPTVPNPDQLPTDC